MGWEQEGPCWTRNPPYFAQEGNRFYGALALSHPPLFPPGVSLGEGPCPPRVPVPAPPWGPLSQDLPLSPWGRQMGAEGEGKREALGDGRARVPGRAWVLGMGIRDGRE